MSVTSAVCDSRMTLPIMPKAPGSVNAAEPPKCGHPCESVNVASHPKGRHPRESGDPFCAPSTTNGFLLARDDDMRVGLSPIDLRNAVTRNQCPIEGLEQWDVDAAALDGVGTASVKRTPGGRVQR
jgi:hypothetical protein